jgi:hypothetical protein
LVHTQASTISNQMRVSASDFPRDDQNPSVDYFRVTSSYPASGQFISRVLEADGTADWGELSATTQEPAGTDITFQTRSGNTTTPDRSWSDWQPVLPGGGIQSPDGKHIQYRATLTTTNTMVTPILERVEISYDLPPTITSLRPRGKITDRTPPISAVILNAPDDLNPTTDIELYVDGVQTDNFSYNASTGKLTHNSGRLSRGRHTIRIEVTAGGGAEAQWTFTIVRRR